MSWIQTSYFTVFTDVHVNGSTRFFLFASYLIEVNQIVQE